MGCWQRPGWETHRCNWWWPVLKANSAFVLFYFTIDWISRNLQETNGYSMQPESLQQQCHMCSTLMNSLHRKFAVEKAFKSFFRLLIRHSDDCKCADDGAGKGWYESPGSFSGAGSCSSALSGVLQCSPGLFWDKKPVEASSAVEFFFCSCRQPPRRQRRRVSECVEHVLQGPGVVPERCWKFVTGTFERILSASLSQDLTATTVTHFQRSRGKSFPLRVLNAFLGILAVFF